MTQFLDEPVTELDADFDLYEPLLEVTVAEVKRSMPTCWLFLLPSLV